MFELTSLISSSTWVDNVIIRKYETWLLFSDSEKHSSLLLKCENDNKKLNNIAPTMTEGCHDNHHIDNKHNDTQNNVTQHK